MRVIFSTLLLLCCAQSLAMTPSPQLSPLQVVRFQLDSLQTNNASGDGIESTFRFASPANKRVTGPLSRFATLFTHPRYAPMLNHQRSDIEQLTGTDKYATFRVELIDQNGLIHHYLFELSRQADGSCVNCWMTDGVRWDPQPGRSA